jgi:hypothetical protein
LKDKESTEDGLCQSISVSLVWEVKENNSILTISLNAETFKKILKTETILKFKMKYSPIIFQKVITSSLTY